MRILIVSPYYPPGLGGACRMLGSIADHFHSRGDTVEALTLQTAETSACAAYDAGSPYSIQRVPAAVQNGKSILRLFAALLRLTLTRRYDLIFCGVAYSSGPLAYLATRLRRVPYVIYCHGEDATIVQRHGRKRAVTAQAMRSAAALMANSRNTARIMSDFGIELDEIDVVYPSIDPRPYEQASEPDAVRLKQQLGLAGKKVILTVARLQERKGHDTVIRALPQLLRDVPDACYAIRGSGDPASLLALADDLGVRNSVVFVPPLAEGDLALLYKLCDVYAMVSRWDPIHREAEGFGMVYLEAGASGKPCVSGGDGGAPEAVVDGVTGLIVKADSPGETACALAAILQDPALAARMGAAGRAIVRERYTEAEFLRKIARIADFAAQPPQTASRRKWRADAVS